ncbi:MAG: pyridoxal phosphate enzyme (YggS family) [Planctomycetota bacterium]|jgi:pyridoxal phosphate enzyme (YggS family)
MQELSDENRRTISANLAKVRIKIAEAAIRVGRSPDEVQLVAVTKTQSAAVIPHLLAEGITAIGESRPEIIVKKQESLGEDISWHMIGHFQRKKIAKSLPHLGVIHSVHCLELLSSLDHAAGQLSDEKKPVEIMIQVNVAQEAQKQGFHVGDIQDVCDLAGAFTRLKLRGLMTMAPRQVEKDKARQVFRTLRTIRDKIGVENVPELSMGMSDDYEMAIEEGATIVRIGSVLFDGLDMDR